jgi:hypothetical protein
MASQDLDPKYWARIRLPEELVDATRAIAKREGYTADQLHLFWYRTLKLAYPEWASMATDLHDLGWLDESE